jgi:molecular chaperone DnaJ
MPADYYEILGASPDATAEDIKRAYKNRAKEWHPDKNDGSEEKFKSLVQANKILSNPETRESYDRKRNTSPESFISRFSGFKGVAKVAAETARKVMNDFVGENIVETIDEILGRKKDPKNIELKISITLEELYSGADKRVLFKRKEPCDSCKGRGAESSADIKVCASCYGIGSSYDDLSDLFKSNSECKKCRGSGKIISKKCVKCKGKGESKYSRDFTFPIPKDLNFGEAKDRLILPKEGEYGGDLIIEVDLKPHKFYEVSWPDLKLELPIKFYQAILGDFIEVETLLGPAIFKIPPGTTHKNAVTLKGYGLRMPDEKGEPMKGDLNITLAVDIPTKINKKQRELLESYKAADRTKKKLQPKKK